MSHDNIDAVQEETERLSAWVIIVSSLGLLIFSLITIVIIQFCVKWYITFNRDANEDLPFIGENQKLEEADLKILSSYKKLDSDKYRIPIEEAIALVVSENAEQSNPNPEKFLRINRTNVNIDFNNKVGDDSGAVVETILPHTIKKGVTEKKPDLKTPPSKTPAAKIPGLKKSSPKNPAPKKSEPKKAEIKKPIEKKPAVKKPAPKKLETKKPEPPKK